MQPKLKWLPLLAILLAGLLAGGPAAAGGVPVLERGAPIHGANGLGFGPDGNLYIASVWGNEIVVLDPNFGTVLDRIGPERGVQTPDDLIFGPDGSLFWTAITTGEVGRLYPDGTKITVANLPPGANPITFSDDGRLFVALAFLGDALYEVDPEGVEPPRLILENLGQLNGMDWGPDGLLYSPIFTQGKVVRIDVDTGEMWTVAEGFAVPGAVKFDSAGRLLVSDQGLGQIIRLNLQDGTREVFAQLTPGLDNLAFDSHGRLFVTHAWDGTVVEVLPTGRPRLVSRGGMIVPGGLAVLPWTNGREAVFVADLWTMKAYDGRTGKPYYPLGAPGKPISPFTAATDGNRLVLSSWIDNAVQVWDPVTGDVIETHYDFAVPLNAIRFAGDLVVAELGTGQVVHAGPAGRVTLAQLAVPSGLAATAGDLWAADWAMGMVFQLVADGAALPRPVPVARGLAHPEGLAVLQDGRLVVVESGLGRVSLIEPATGAVIPFFESPTLGVSDIPGVPPTIFFNGVAVGATGAVYVSDDGAGVLYRIDQLLPAPAKAPVSRTSYLPVVLLR